VKKSSLLLCGLFLFGVYALPGKVCASPGNAVTSQSRSSDLPPCHRQAANSKKTPCEKMVCCLLPDVSRGMGAVVILPSPEFSGMVALPVSQDTIVFVLSHRISFSAHAPPGPSGLFPSSASPRGPPLA
jgi:hypothetical protein